MESLIISICALLLLYSPFRASIDIQNHTLKARAEDAIFFENHLAPANKINLPFRVRGVPSFDASAITAQSAMMVDEGTGRVLFEKDSYQKKSIASLTKLMTALVWWEIDGDLNKIVEIKSEDYREGGISYFIAGERVRAKDLLHAGLIASSNSAIVSLVKSTGLTSEDFVTLMNKKAEALGMQNTRFKEPTGLDYKNISTAVDCFILAREAFKNPIISKATQLKSYKFKPLGKSASRLIRSTNWLLSESANNNYEILGGKTGYIEESGYNLIIRARNKEKDKNLITIILGSNNKGSRFAEAKKLIEWTYANHIWEI